MKKLYYCGLFILTIFSLQQVKALSSMKEYQLTDPETQGFAKVIAKSFAKEAMKSGRIKEFQIRLNGYFICKETFKGIVKMPIDIIITEKAQN